VTKSLRGARVAAETALALCLAWCCTSCSVASSRPSAPGLAGTPCPTPRAAGPG